MCGDCWVFKGFWHYWTSVTTIEDSLESSVRLCVLTVEAIHVFWHYWISVTTIEDSLESSVRLCVLTVEAIHVFWHYWISVTTIEDPSRESSVRLCVLTVWVFDYCWHYWTSVTTIEDSLKSPVWLCVVTVESVKWLLTLLNFSDNNWGLPWKRSATVCADCLRLYMSSVITEIQWQQLMTPFKAQCECVRWLFETLNLSWLLTLLNFSDNNWGLP